MMRTPQGGQADLSRFLKRYLSEQRLSVVGALLAFFVIGLALVGPFLAAYDPNVLGPDSLISPTRSHLMGTDQFGRDVFSRWLHAGRISLLVAIVSVSVAGVFGSLGGVIAGYKNGSWIDTLVMRTVDAILSVPLIVLVVAIAGTVGSRGLQIGPVRLASTGVLILVMAIAFIPPFARIARASALAEMQEDYLSAARALGMGATRIVFANLFPNVLPPLVIQASFSLAVAIGVEATVSFLGFGVTPPQASWGNLLFGSRDYILIGKWWLVLFPIAIIVVAVFSFNLLGDGLRDLLDPRQRSRVAS